MSDINTPDKVTGDPHTAAEYNAFKAAINSKADSTELDATNTTLATKANILVTARTVTANTALLIGDVNGVVRTNVGASNTVTVPLNGTVAFAVGTMVTVRVHGAGGTTITPAGGVTLNGNLDEVAQYGSIVLHKVATNEWDVYSSGAAAPSLIQLSTPTLTATMVSDTEIGLSWTNVANESSYKLEWSANGTTGWTQIGGTIAANTTTYDHSGLTAETQYFYRISAIGDGVTYATSAFGTDDATTDEAAPSALTMDDVDWYARYKGSSGITQSGGLVSKWADMIGTNPTAFDLEQATSGNRPTYQATALNGHPGLEFNSDNLMISGTFPAGGASSPITQILVLDLLSLPGAYKFALANVAGPGNKGIGIDPANKLYIESGGALVGANALTTGRHIIWVEHIAANSVNVYVDGVLDVSGDAGAITAYTSLKVGYAAPNTPDMIVGEIAIYSGTFTSQERDDLHAELSTYYDI